MSLGCGNTPDARREKAGSLFLDLGSVLLETSLSVDRTHEALSTLMPLVPGCRYYRFNPIDKRCGMAPDSVDPVAWAALRAATQEYCATQEARLDELASLLSNGASEAEAGAAGGAGDASGGRAGRVRSIGSDGGAASGAPAPGASLRLGFRKGLLVVQALRSSLAAAASPVELADDVVAQLPHVVHVTPLSKPKLSAPESHAVDDGSSSDSADEGADSTSSDAAAGDAAAPAAPPTASTTSSLFNYFSGYFSPAATGAALPATPASSAHKAAAAAASTTATPAAASSSAQQQQQLQPVEMELMPVGASAAAEMQTHGSHRSGGGRGILSPHPAGGWRLSTSALLQAAPWSSSEDPSKPGPNASAAPENAARPANQEPGDQPSTTTATAAAAALVGRERLRHVLSIYGDRSGVVHLGVHSVAGSPVLSWHHDVFSVLEPSQQAAELLKLLRPVQQQQRVRDGRRSRAGSTGGGPAVAPPLASGHHACAASLSELCAQHSCFQLPGGMLLTVLSRQEVTTPTGATLSSFIFQRTSPAELLTPYDVSAMLDHWHHQVVVCPSHLAPELVDALLRAGARAVVSCAAPLEPLTAAASLPAGSPADDASFWSVFYGAFFGGEPLGRALQQAEAAHKQLTGRFVLQCK